MANSIRRRRQRAKNQTGLWLIIGVLGVLAALLTTYIVIKQRHVKLNKETLCPTDGPRELTVILIDRTDPLTTVQQADLRKRLDNLKNQTARYGGIALYTVAPIGNKLLQPEGQLICNPGRGKDIDPKIGNPKLVEQKWHERFSAPLDQLFDKQAQPGQAAVSPLMESIQSVAIANLQRFHGREFPRRLVIVSDMLQYMPSKLSQYKEIIPFQMFRESSYYRQVRTDLSGVEVEIVYVRRDTQRHVQGKAHIVFWQKYIADMGGILTRVISLQG
jgi:hypothetical protein